MADIKVIELPEGSVVSDTDYLMFDTGTITYKVKKANLLKELTAEIDSYGFSVVNGKLCVTYSEEE